MDFLGLHDCFYCTDRNGKSKVHCWNVIGIEEIQRIRGLPRAPFIDVRSKTVSPGFPVDPKRALSRGSLLSNVPGSR
jgi:hypothetical protein